MRDAYCLTHQEFLRYMASGLADPLLYSITTDPGFCIFCLSTSSFTMDKGKLPQFMISNVNITTSSRIGLLLPINSSVRIRR